MLSSRDITDTLIRELDSLPRELKKAARFVIENPTEIGICSMREAAAQAETKPNTFIRLAQAIGFEGYEVLRQPFIDDIRNREPYSPNRAKMLQEIYQRGELPGLYVDAARATLNNVEQVFAQTDSGQIEEIARSIIQAKSAYVLGIGVAAAVAENFAYLASIALKNVSAIPRGGYIPIDGLLTAQPGDALIAMTFKPYRREIVDAVKLAQELGMTITAISDSPAAPIINDADYKLVVPTSTPQFFTSMVPVTALLETIIAHVVAEADEEAIQSITTFQNRRNELGVYWDND